MADDEKYNGWTNYETWTVNLWLTNDEGSDRHWRRVAQDYWDEAVPTKHLTRDEVASQDLAERLKSDIEDGNPLADAPSVYSQLLTGTFSDVNWDEIASAWITDVDKTEEP